MMTKTKADYLEPGINCLAICNCHAWPTKYGMSEYLVDQRLATCLPGLMNLLQTTEFYITVPIF
jgi:hypothetical protein